MRVLVAGAGLAGLGAAFRLHRDGHDVRVLEANDRVGGRTATVERDGYRMDVAASLLSTKYTRLVELAAECGAQDEIITGGDVIGILRDGRVHRLRGNRPLDAVRTPLLGPWAKVAAARVLVDAYRAGSRLSWEDLSRAADLDTESAEEYCERKLPGETARYLVEPIVRTIYLGNVGDVSIVDLLFTLRHFFGGSFVNGAGGIDFLCRALARSVEVELGAEVREVAETGGGVAVSYRDAGGEDRTEEADACVIALGAHEMAGIHAGLGDETRELAEGLEYADLMSVQIALSRPPDEPATALSLPRSEQPDLCAIVLEHNKAPDRAPAGKGLIGSYWDPAWVARHWDADDATAGERGVEGVARILPGIEDDVEFTTVHRFRRGILVARPGTYGRLRRFHELYPEDSRIQLAGDYIGGSTTNSALCSGEAAARRLGALRLAA